MARHGASCSRREARGFLARRTPVPDDARAMRLSLRVDGKSFRFRDLNDLLAKANRERSGDRLAGLAARSAQERVAARRLLAEVTLAEL
ncbi:MAG TPA: ethanolamine ammonia-lyase subunit EutB, partial [Planctomycetota bacterium]|nr:ethanolamine ammonia-lyase subunit EutB [Planctomycetota bacterium]